MDAAADYAAAVRMLQTTLPAYVSYVERTYGSAGSLTKDMSQTIVVRTRDGAIVKGDPQKVKISTDSDVPVNPVSHPPFNAACYTAREARATEWEGHDAEAIALHETCGKHRADSDMDFGTLYVDPETHQPLAAVAVHDEDQVTVTLEQRLGRFDGHVMPSALHVHLQGHGIVGFIDLTLGQDYRDYAFSNSMP